VSEPPPDPIACGKAPEPLAFQMKERNFVQCIQSAEAIIEFKTINDREGIAQPDMFRPQVAMTVD
jgi:hypothetical protein